MKAPIVSLLFVLLFFCGMSAVVAGPGTPHLNKVVAKLEAGRPVTGIWCLSRSPANARSLVEYNGFPDAEAAITEPMIDFLVVAMEHYPYDISELRAFSNGLVSRREALAKGNLQPNLAWFVRIPAEGSQPVHAMIKQVLDIGAVFFGPGDFTVSSGRRGDPGFDTAAAEVKIRAACAEAGVPFLGFANADNIRRRIDDDGVRMLLIGADIDKTGGAHRALEVLRGNP